MTPSPTVKVIVAGLGGQGVIFLARLLAKTAITQGYPVMVSETHGMSQRGGSVISHFKIGSSQAPLIRRGTADLLLALDPTEAIRNLPFLRPGAALFVNSETCAERSRSNGLPAEVTTLLRQLDIEVHCLAASRMATEIGSVGIANVIMAGFAVAGFAATRPALFLSIGAVRQTIASMALRGRDLNLKALEAGFQAAQVTQV